MHCLVGLVNPGHGDLGTVVSTLLQWPAYRKGHDNTPYRVYAYTR
jgi:hypothetical protein